jgi:hypothetical protein
MPWLQFSGYHRGLQCVTSKPGPEVDRIAGLSALDNNTVNLVSAFLTATIMALTAYAMAGF